MKRKYHAFNVIPLGGVGFACSWGSEEPKDFLAATEGDGHAISHNLRAGLQFEANVAKIVADK